MESSEGKSNGSLTKKPIPTAFGGPSSQLVQPTNTMLRGEKKKHQSGKHSLNLFRCHADKINQVKGTVNSGKIKKVPNRCQNVEKLDPRRGESSMMPIPRTIIFNVDQIINLAGKKETEVDQRWRRCPLCGLSCSDPGAYWFHMYPKYEEFITFPPDENVDSVENSTIQQGPVKKSKIKSKTVENSKINTKKVKRSKIMPETVENLTSQKKSVEDSTIQKKSVEDSTIEFQCEFKDCNKILKTARGLMEHKRIHTGETPFPCPSCPLKFQTHVQIFRHKIKCHASPSKKFKQISKALKTEMKKAKKTTEKRSSSARIKTKVKVRSPTLKKARLVKEKIRNSNSGTMAKAKARLQQKQRSKMKSFQCPQCPRLFWANATLLIHVHNSHREGLKCKTCNKEFLNKRIMVKHESSCQLNPPSEANANDNQAIPNGVPIKCTFCHAPHFENKEELVAHLKSFHRVANINKYIN